METLWQWIELAAAHLTWWQGILLVLLVSALVIVLPAGAQAVLQGLKNLKPQPDTTGIETPGGGPGDEWLKTHPQPPTTGRPPESESGSGG